MRFQENITTSCAKMTEERSINGGLDLPSGSKRNIINNTDEVQNQLGNSPGLSEKPSAISGGSLKFYKNGKFILELSHQKEGDRTYWASVTKRTSWAPPVVVGTPRQESSTSLSVSDDNSSVQSSPWQRDHCWKQSHPRRGQGKEFTFYMNMRFHIKDIYHQRSKLNVRKIGRCPYSPIIVSVLDRDLKNYDIVKSERKSTKYHNKIDSLIQSLWSRFYSSSVSESGSVGTLNFSHQNSVHAVATSSGRFDPSIISPRKRILREFERVSLEDSTYSNKRQKSRPVVSSALPVKNFQNNSSTTLCQTQQVSPPPQLSKSGVKNYSITSLLGTGQNDEVLEDKPSVLRTLLLPMKQESAVSPEPVLPSARHKSSPSLVQYSPPTHSPSPESLRPGIHTSVPQISSLLTPHPVFSPYIPHNHYYSPLSSVPSSIWVHYPYSSLPRGPYYTDLGPPCHPPPLTHCHWDPVSQPTLVDIKREDSASDMPLNLSKNSS